MPTILIKILSARLEYRGIDGSVDWDEETGLYRAVVMRKSAVVAWESRTIRGLLNRFRACARSFLKVSKSNAKKKSNPGWAGFTVTTGHGASRKDSANQRL